MMYIEFIRQNADKLSDREIGEKLGLSKGQVRRRRKWYNIPSTHGITGAFVKGGTPWNKGKPHLNGGVQTRFKPGTIPPNTKYNGAISFRRDGKHIRVSEGVWIPYKRYLWEKEYGPIPGNHVIVSKDGNRLTEDVNNMECISRAENARRNANRKKAAETLCKTWEKQKRRIRMGLSPSCKLGLHKPNKNVRGIVREPAKHINFD